MSFDLEVEVNLKIGLTQELANLRVRVGLRVGVRLRVEVDLRVGVT